MTFAEELGLFQATIEKTRSGDPTLALGTRRLLSAHDPRKEAERQALVGSDARVTLVGLGLGYLADALGSRLVEVITAAGEEERCLSVRTDMGPSVCACYRSCATMEAIETALRSAVQRGDAILFDPAWSANPELISFLKDAIITERYGSVAFVRGSGAEFPDTLIDQVLHHQGRHTFDDYQPITFESLPAPGSLLGTKAARILFIQPSSIGDVLYFTPTLAALKEGHPRAHVGVIVDEDSASLLTSGDADELFVIRRADWMAAPRDERSSVRTLLEALKEFRADVVVNPHASARAALYATIAGQGQAPILGMHFRSEGHPICSGNLHHARWLTEMGSSLSRGAIPVSVVPPPELGSPWCAAADLARRSGVPRIVPRPVLHVNAQDRERVEFFLNEAGLTSATNLVAVHTGSRARERRYRRDAWPLVAEGLTQDLGLSVVWIGGPDDQERIAWIAERTRVKTSNATARGDLRFTAALLERCVLLVGPETSTAHLAAAVGTPALTITGRVLSGWSGASSPRSLVLHGPADPPWCRVLEPSLVVKAARFVLERGDLPSLPDGFQTSWTGNDSPTEFFRERAPNLQRDANAYAETLLGLAWANLVDEINGDLGYSVISVSAADARSWLGLPPTGVRHLIARYLEEHAGAFWKILEFSSEVYAEDKKQKTLRFLHEAEG